MKKTHSLNDFGSSRLRDLMESMIQLEASGAPAIYQDMAGDGGYIAFASDYDYQIYVNALDFLGHGSAYGGADNTFEVADENIAPKKVVPTELTAALNIALDNEDEQTIDDLVGQTYVYFWDEEYEE